MKWTDQLFLATIHGYGCSFLIGSILAVIIIVAVIKHFIF
jgi:hypothetical protein